MFSSAISALNLSFNTKPLTCFIPRLSSVSNPILWRVPIYCLPGFPRPNTNFITYCKYKSLTKINNSVIMKLSIDTPSSGTIPALPRRSTSHALLDVHHRPSTRTALPVPFRRCAAYVRGTHHDDEWQHDRGDRPGRHSS